MPCCCCCCCCCCHCASKSSNQTLSTFHSSGHVCSLIYLSDARGTVPILLGWLESRNLRQPFVQFEFLPLGEFNKKLFSIRVRPWYVRAHVLVRSNLLGFLPEARNNPIQLIHRGIILFRSSDRTSYVPPWN